MRGLKHCVYYFFLFNHILKPQTSRYIIPVYWNDPIREINIYNKNRVVYMCNATYFAHGDASKVPEM